MCFVCVRYWSFEESDSERVIHPSKSTTAIMLIQISRWNPDPHVLRVGDTYYIATSSFNVFPGVPIYRSKNLVDWELLSHAIHRPGVMPLYSSRADNGRICPPGSSASSAYHGHQVSGPLHCRSSMAPST